MLKLDHARLILGTEALAIIGVVYFLATLDLISLARTVSIAVAVPALLLAVNAQTTLRHSHPERRPERAQAQRGQVRLRPVGAHLGRVLGRFGWLRRRTRPDLGPPHTAHVGALPARSSRLRMSAAAGWMNYPSAETSSEQAPALDLCDRVLGASVDDQTDG
jgi:hypothetical protein